MKTAIEMICDDLQYQEWIKDERGYIDGYCQIDKYAYVAIVLDNRVILCKINQFKVIGIYDSFMRLVSSY